MRPSKDPAPGTENFHKLYGGSVKDDPILEELDFEDEVDSTELSGRITIGPGFYTNPDIRARMGTENPEVRDRKKITHLLEETFKSVRMIELTQADLEREAKLNTWINLIKACTLGAILMWLMF